MRFFKSEAKFTTKELNQLFSAGIKIALELSVCTAKTRLIINRKIIIVAITKNIMVFLSLFGLLFLPAKAFLAFINTSNHPKIRCLL